MCIRDSSASAIDTASAASALLPRAGCAGRASLGNDSAKPRIPGYDAVPGSVLRLDVAAMLSQR
eukprot:1873545-Prorocentrum_lima.AAC.1